jgi:hypothetical protein
MARERIVARNILTSARCLSRAKQVPGLRFRDCAEEARDHRRLSEGRRAMRVSYCGAT